MIADLALLFAVRDATHLLVLFVCLAETGLASRWKWSRTIRHAADLGAECYPVQARCIHHIPTLTPTLAHGELLPTCVTAMMRPFRTRACTPEGLIGPPKLFKQTWALVTMVLFPLASEERDHLWVSDRRQCLSILTQPEVLTFALRSLPEN